ncbi:MAG: shikimate kinase [Candidatus Riflebacteria bacterium]|nr:shikimate kinase [Candidatus Riflebacteria bacterium]
MNIILIIGFMGCGKTTCGKMVAEKLGYDFFDLDDKIEEYSKTDINSIFEKYGEHYFRAIEHKVFVDLLLSMKRTAIVAAGGGLVTNIDNFKHIQNCLTIFLDVPWAYIKERLPLLKETRPLLKNKTIKEIYNLWLTRKNKYFKYADLTIKITKNNNYEE